jgi:NhaA family Na+:H+ antiporter
MVDRILRLPPKHAPHRALTPEVLAGILLMGTTVAAMVWANSPWAASYEAFWGFKLTVGTGAWELSKPLVVWVNDLLMAVFFLLVGLEIKREFIGGSLSAPRKAALPLAAALGGMVVPALFYLSLNWGGAGEAGWGVPMATDIAFALGLLAILGRGAPVALKVLLAAVAIVDDLGAILVIAIAYTSDISTTALLWAGGFVALLAVANRLGSRRPWPYVILGLGLWYALLRSGVHATLAGVLLAFTIPMGPDRSEPETDSLLHGMEHALHPWVVFLIVPVFALANAGVALGAGAAGRLLEPVGMGVLLGLVLGKQIGIMSFSWLAVRTRLAELPDGVTWRYLHGLAALCGVGFTMSLFIGHLAYDEAALLEQAKTAILAASALSAILGKVLLDAAARDVRAKAEAARARREDDDEPTRRPAAA